ncbi:hypothetical protein JCM6882_007937 [Rhodosporidiobolus microsporus]
MDRRPPKIMDRGRFDPVQTRRPSLSRKGSSRKGRSDDHRPSSSSEHSHSASSDDGGHSLRFLSKAGGSNHVLEPLSHPKHSDKATLARLMHGTDAEDDLERFDKPEGKQPFSKRMKAFWHDLSPTFRTIFVGLMLFAIGTSLDNTTASQFIPYATSAFAEHSALGIVLTAQAVVLAVVRILATKESIIIGLGWSFLAAVVFFVAGYVLISFSPSIMVYAAGTLLSTVGTAAFVALPSVAIIKYSAKLGDNALLNSFLSTPYYITGWVGSFIVEGVISNLGWRWGYRLYAILVPVSSAPLLVALFRAESKFKVDEADRKRHEDLEAAAGRGEIPLPGADSLIPRSSGHTVSHRPRISVQFNSLAGHVPHLTEHSLKKGVSTGMKKGLSKTGRGLKKTAAPKGHLGDLDATGLLLLAVGLGCTLSPVALIGQGLLEWQSPISIGLLIGGALALVLFPVNEKFARSPLFPNGLYKVRRIIITLLTTWLNMTSFFLLLAYQYSFIQVLHPTWSPLVQGFFAFSEQFTLTLVHLFASFPMSSLVAKQTKLKFAKGGDQLTTTEAGKKLLKHPMWWLAGSHGVRVIGVGLMILSRRQVNANAGWITLLVASQVIHGAGGGCASVYNIQIAMAWAPTGNGKLFHQLCNLVLY